MLVNEVPSGGSQHEIQRRPLHLYRSEAQHYYIYQYLELLAFSALLSDAECNAAEHRPIETK